MDYLDQFKEEWNVKFDQHNFEELHSIYQDSPDEIFTASIVLYRVDIMQRMLSPHSKFMNELYDWICLCCVYDNSPGLGALLEYVVNINEEINHRGPSQYHISNKIIKRNIYGRYVHKFKLIAKDRNKGFLLFLVMSRRNTEILKLLIKHNIDIRVNDDIVLYSGSYYYYDFCCNDYTMSIDIYNILLESTAYPSELLIDVIIIAIKKIQSIYVDILKKYICIDDDVQLTIFRRVFDQTTSTIPAVKCFINYFDILTVPQEEINQFLECLADYKHYTNNHQTISSLTHKHIDVSAYVDKAFWQILRYQTPDLIKSLRGNCTEWNAIVQKHMKILADLI